MSIDTFVAGRYAGTWSAGALGTTEEGFELFQDTHAEMINNSDAFGDTLLDWVWRGSSVYLMVRSLTFTTTALAAFYPYGATIVAPGGFGVLTAATSVVPIGTLASDLAKALVLTVTASTPAALYGSVINTLTASLSLLRPNSNLSLLFNSKLRKVPLAFQVLPKLATGAYNFFVTT